MEDLPYGAAQHEFIERVRADIKNFPDTFFQKKDWRNITPPQGRYVPLNPDRLMAAEEFYVRPVAVWVPHLIIPDFIPACTRCESSVAVNVHKGKFIDRPKILFGVKGHRYLDTVVYHCNQCKRPFNGFTSMELKVNAKRELGFFDIFLQKDYAVEADLFSVIVNSHGKPTSMIASQLKQNYADSYYADSTYYYSAVRAWQLHNHGNNNQKRSLEAGYRRGAQPRGLPT